MGSRYKTKAELIAELKELRLENRSLKYQLSNSNVNSLWDDIVQDNITTDFSDTKEYFELMFNTSPDAVVISRLNDARVLKVNDAFTKITGYSREEALCSTTITLNLWGNLTEREFLVNEALKNGHFENFESVFVRKNGSRFPALISAKTFLFKGIPHIYSITRDISDLKRTEDALRKSELEIQKNFAVLNSVFESSQNVIIFSLDANYCYMAFTSFHKQTMKQIWGVDIEIGMNMLDQIHDSKDRAKAKHNFDLTLKGEHLRFEEEYGDLSLHRNFYENIYNPIIDSKGDVIGLSVFVIDITERKLVEDELRINEERYRLLAENARDVIWTMKLDGTITYISPAVEQLRGLTVDEAMNQPINEILTPDSQQIIFKYLQQLNSAVLSGSNLKSFKGELEYYRKDGSKLWTEVIVYPLFEGDENSVTILGVTRDISERKINEKALVDSEEKYRALYSNMYEGSALHTLVYDDLGNAVDYRIIEVNPAFESQLGISREDVINKTSCEAYGVDQPPFLDVYSRVVFTGKPEVFEAYFKPLDKYFSISVYCPYKGSFATIFENITERKTAEKERQILLTKYQVLFDIFPIGITVSDEFGKIIESNSIAEILLGISKEEQEKRKISGEEWRIVRLDGTPMPPDEFASVRALEEEHTVANVEMGIVKDNNRITWINVSAASIPLEGYGVAIVYSDITTRKEAEAELLKSKDMLKKFAIHLQTKQEEDRALLATKLDNELGQILVALKMEIGMLKNGMLKDNLNSESIQLFKKLDEAHNMIGNSIKTTIKFMNDLRYEVLYLMGFVEAVKLYSTDFYERNNIKCNFISTVQRLEINENVSVSLFRILQIALENVAEHSKATEVEIILNMKDEKVILEIVDNGIGFNPKTQLDPKENGLIFMKERTLLMNGTFEIKSAINKGTTISVEIPV